jgi:hypothetical protein
MAKVTHYQVLYYATAAGDQGNRAQIQLMDDTAVLGWIRFHDPGMPFPPDTQIEGKIAMHLPSAMIEHVLELLRNEIPLNYYFVAGHAFLGTSSEPVGECEQEHLDCPDVPADLPMTRAPIPFEWRGYNYFTIWKNSQEAFETEMSELSTYPPILLFPEGGFHGHVENPFQWGVVKGINDEVYGDWSTQGIGEILAAGLPSPEQMTQRLADLPNYLAEYKGLTKPAPYVDLGTQIYGHHLTRTGFWFFYDHWDEYAAPTGPIDLGEKPPEPTTWLRKWHDADTSSVCPYPPSEWEQKCSAFSADELESLKGLSFFYSPKKPLYGAYFRYPVCLNTQGWELWWKQIIQWIARIGFQVAFVDNTLFGNCWNEECQVGYRAWLATKYSKAEITRLFTVSTSLLYDHSFETNWFQVGDENGPWQTNYAYASSGALFPDIESYGGRYSARLDGPGELWLYPYPLKLELLPPEEQSREYTLTIHYKTAGQPQATLRIRQLDAGNTDILNEPLPTSTDWTAFTVQFQVPRVRIRVHFTVDGVGQLWVDENWLSVNGTETLQHPTFKTELAAGEDVWNYAGRLRQWASGTYWDAVVDDKIVYLRNKARKINPAFQIFTNSYFQRHGSDYFLGEDQALEFENRRQDAGHPPGIYQPAPEGEPPRTLRTDPGTGAPLPVTTEVLNTNIFDYKYTYARRLPDFFGYHLHALVSTDSYYRHNPDSALLLHAEVAAFGGGAGIDMQLRVYYQDYDGEAAPFRLELRALSQQFFQFVDQHRDLYECLWSYGEVGLAYHDIRSGIENHNEIFELAQGLASHGVLWGLLTEECCNAVNLARYKILIYHDVERIAESEAQALLNFVQNGGLLIVSGSDAGTVGQWTGYTRFYIGMLDEFFRLRAANSSTVWPPVYLSGTQVQAYDIELGRLISVPAGTLTVHQVIQWSEAYFAEKVTSRQLGVFSNLFTPAMERMRVAAWAGQEKLILHLVNYNVPLGKENRDQVEILSSIEVKVKLPTVWVPSSVQLYTPEAVGSSGELAFSVTPDGVITFVIPALHIYEIALIE